MRVCACVRARMRAITYADWRGEKKNDIQFFMWAEPHQSEELWRRRTESPPRARRRSISRAYTHRNKIICARVRRDGGGRLRTRLRSVLRYARRVCERSERFSFQTFTRL